MPAAHRAIPLRNTDCHRDVCVLCSLMINDKRQLACMSVAEDGLIIEPPPKKITVKDLVHEMD